MGDASLVDEMLQSRVLLLQMILTTSIGRILLRFLTTKPQRLASRRISAARKLLRDSGSKRRVAILEGYIEMEEQKIVLGRSLYQQLALRDERRKTESVKDYKRSSLALQSLRQILPIALVLGPFLAFEYAFKGKNYVIAKFDHCVNPQMFESLWSLGTGGNSLKCDELSAFWVFSLWCFSVHPLLQRLIIGGIFHVPIADRLEICWMAREMGKPDFEAVNLTGNEDLVVHLPDIVEMEESVLFSE